MSVFHCSSTYTYGGNTYTSGSDYQIRAKECEALIALGKGSKSATKKKKK